MFHYSILERLAKEKYSNLVGPFVSYEENDVLQMWHQGRYSQHFNLILTYEWDQEVFHYSILERLAKDKHCNLFDLFESYEKINCCALGIRADIHEASFLS